MLSELFDEETKVNIVFLKNNKKTKNDIWLIHGFTEDSSCFNSIINTPLYDNFNIFMLDLPGCGRSGFEKKYENLESVIESLSHIINRYSFGRKKIVLGHSLGGMIATLLIPLLEKVSLFLNVDGMLLEDKGNYRSLTKSISFSSPEKFIEYMVSHLRKVAQGNFYLERYVKNILNSNQIVTYSWARSSTYLLKENKVDDTYDRLRCPKLYIYGDKTISRLERDYLATKKYNKCIISEVGHWPMLENPEKFWSVISKSIMSITSKQSALQGNELV